jgi:hypothetical protein
VHMKYTVESLSALCLPTEGASVDHLVRADPRHSWDGCSTAQERDRHKGYSLPAHHKRRLRLSSAEGWLQRRGILLRLLPHATCA